MKKDIFGDEVDAKPQDDFATMFEQMQVGGKKLRNGDVFDGEVLSIGKTEVFVSTGTPVDGALPTKDLLDKEGKVTVKVGDRIQVQVVRQREGEILLKKANQISSSQDVDNLEDAFDMELPVEGKITEVVKGGVRVSIQGKTAFCPISQIDLARVEDASQYIGFKGDFLITQFDERGRNIVVSRRKILELQKAEKEGEFIGAAKVGEIYQGTVIRMEKFGAFVRLEEGPEGLVPISEIAWGRIGHPQEVLTMGQKVSVKLLSLEETPDRLRMSFSIKQAGGESDPWLSVVQNFPLGSVHKGTVEKKENFGVFVSIAPGISGLLPRSKWRDSGDVQKYENLKKGDIVEISIAEIKFEEKRLTFGIPGTQEDESWRAHIGGDSSSSGGGGKFTNSSLGGLAALMGGQKLKK
jgi:small subunit ribosomal protein S1